MKEIFVLVVFLLTLGLHQTAHAQSDPPIYAQVIQSPSACIRPLPDLSESCSYNISYGELSVLLTGQSADFYKIDYVDDQNQHHIGWIWRNRVVLIYP